MKYTLPAAIIISAILFSYAYMNRQTDYQFCVEDLKANATTDNTTSIIRDRDGNDVLQIDRIHLKCRFGK